MSNLIPRLDPPQPKVFEMGPPPNFTVPDVTHLYDSEDSLVWKPSENTFERSKKTNKIEYDRVVPLLQNKNKRETIKDNKENAAINMVEPVFKKHSPKIIHQNILRLESQVPTSASPTTTASNVNNNNILETSEQNRFRLNKGYCPEQYCSPKQNLPQQRTEHKVLQSQVINNEIDKMRHLAYGPNICSVNNNCDVGVKNIKSSISKYSPQATGILHRCECCNNQDLLRNNHQLHFPPLPNSCHPPVLESYQSSILKVIEKQNQHILYLQNILEKLLQNSISKDGSVSPNCNRCSDLDKSNQKDVSTQTSYPEFLPETKSIGTNTDREDLKQNIPSNNINNKNSCNKNCCQKKDYNSEVLKNYVNDSSKKERILDHDDQNDYHSLKNNNNMEPLYNAPSPKPIQMDMCKYNGNECPDCQDCNYRLYQNNVYEEIGFSNAPKAGESAPLAGESAMMYNERYMQNQQQFAINPNNDEVVQEENGVTFFNRVMINVQQVLHKSNIQDKNEKKFRKGCSAPAKNAATGALYNNNPTLQQLQQFGISFLDPVTLEDKRKPTRRVRDPFNELEVINAKNKGRPTNNYTADSHLAFIAQNSPAMIVAHRAQYAGDKEIQPIDEEPNEAFSIATKQFLDRYKLENDYDK